MIDGGSVRINIRVTAVETSSSRIGISFSCCSSCWCCCCCGGLAGGSDDEMEGTGVGGVVDRSGRLLLLLVQLPPRATTWVLSIYYSSLVFTPFGVPTVWSHWNKVEK